MLNPAGNSNLCSSASKTSTLCVLQQHRALAALLQMGLKQTPYAWRHVVIEMIRDLPATSSATRAAAYPRKRLLPAARMRNLQETQ